MHFKHIIISLFLLPALSWGQVASDSALFQEVKELDQLLFGQGFNNCNMETLASIVSDDLEFFHDKGGITMGKEAFVNTFKNNMCGKEQKHSRELVKGSLEVFPLHDKGVLYGAIQKGMHEFYIQYPGKDKFIDGVARFTHLWLKTPEGWKLSRALSYDHQPPSQDIKKMKLSIEKLQSLTGTYKAPQSGTVVITIVDGKLHINAGEMQTTIEAQSELLFAHPQAPLIFEFVKNGKGKVSKFLVREQNKLVEEAKKTK